MRWITRMLEFIRREKASILTMQMDRLMMKLKARDMVILTNMKDSWMVKMMEPIGNSKRNNLRQQLSMVKWMNCRSTRKFKEERNSFTVSKTLSEWLRNQRIQNHSSIETHATSRMVLTNSVNSMMIEAHQQAWLRKLRAWSRPIRRDFVITLN